MLVDTMEYQGPSGMGSLQGGSQDDAFYELLSSTGLASASAHANGHAKKSPAPEFNFGSDDVLPSYDFQPSSSLLANKSTTSSPRVEEAQKLHAPPASAYAPASPSLSLGLQPPTATEPTLRHGREGVETMAAVEQTMKKFADNLLHMMESMTGRIAQLESTTHRLEQMMTDFKGGSEKHQGASGGKLLVIENMLLEVQRGVQVLRDRQEIVEAHSQLAKLHLVGKEGIPSAPVPTQAPLEPPAQSPQSPQFSEVPPQQMRQPPHHNHPPAHPPPPPHIVPPPAGPPQTPALQQLQPHPAIMKEPHYQPPQQATPSPHQLSPQHSGPFYSPQQQQQHQQQQQAPPPPPPPHQHGPPHPGPQFNHQPEIPPYGPHPQGPHQGPAAPGNYGQELPSSYINRPFLPPGPQLPQPGPAGPQMYDHSVGGSSSNSMALPPPYHSQGRPAAPVYDQQMGGPPPSYASPGYRTGQQTPSAPSSGAGGYPRLPTAQPVQHAMPTAREGASPSSGAAPLSTNRIAIDEVIDKVAVMGFSKDQVRTVVRRLTENGQSVDLNIVLDKLMNGGGDAQPQKSWFRG